MASSVGHLLHAPKTPLSGHVIMTDSMNTGNDTGARTLTFSIGTGDTRYPDRSRIGVCSWCVSA